MNTPMDRQEAMDKFDDILSIIEVWADEDIRKGSIMRYGDFEATVIGNEYNNPMFTIWSYYMYLTGAEDIY